MSKSFPVFSRYFTNVPFVACVVVATVVLYFFSVYLGEAHQTAIPAVWEVLIAPAILLVIGGLCGLIPYELMPGPKKDFDRLLVTLGFGFILALVGLNTLLSSFL